MSPTSFKHDNEKTLAALLIEQYLIAKNLPFEGSGSLTLARELLECGCEPDESYYIQAEPPPPGTRDIDLSIHNPPDLVIEVDLTSHSVDKEPIYAALGVAELWRWELDTLTIRRLRDDRAGYETIDRSTLLPDLPIDALAEHLRLGRQLRQHEVLKRWRDRIAL